MSGVLSQEEIDQLLKAIDAKDSEPEDFKPKMLSKKIMIYDFKRPDKFTRRQIRNVAIIHETFSRLTTVSLSAQLRTMAFVHVASVDQLTYEEFIRSVPTPTTVAIINMDPLPGNVILEIDPYITDSIIDRICGGTGEKPKSRHELTDIEESVMENIIVRMSGNIRESWRRTEIDLRPRVLQIDTNPQYIDLVPPTEMVILVTLETKINDVEGFINLCFPITTITPAIGNISTQYNTPLQFINREYIPIRLSAEIFRRDYSVKEILKWEIETLILPLCPSASGFCYLRFGDRRVWQCKILPDCKWFSKKIMIVNYAEEPFRTEGNDMDMDNNNSIVARALSCAKMMISVELGTTLKTVKEVFAMGEGTIVELDKFAGEPVDIKANGVLIGRGEVLVIDEKFGVRITEISGSPDTSNQFEKSCSQQPEPKPPEPEDDKFGDSNDFSEKIKGN